MGVGVSTYNVKPSTSITVNCIPTGHPIQWRWREWSVREREWWNRGGLGQAWSSSEAPWSSDTETAPCTLLKITPTLSLTIQAGALKEHYLPVVYTASQTDILRHMLTQIWVHGHKSMTYSRQLFTSSQLALEQMDLRMTFSQQYTLYRKCCFVWLYGVISSRHLGFLKDVFIYCRQGMYWVTL